MIRSRQKGQGLTEFALILPILLLVLLGIIEASRIIWAYITIQNAAREAARYAVTGQPLDAQGDPWTALDVDRVRAIKQVAADASSALQIDFVAGLNDTVQGQELSATAPEYWTNSDRPRVLGVMVRGQRVTDDEAEMREGTVNHPGQKGLNVLVRVYYNITMLDPIYDTLLGGRHIHLNGEAVLQNEGLNMALGGELPPFAPPEGDRNPGGGSGTLDDEVLDVLWKGGPTNQVPAGSDVDLQLSNHFPPEGGSNTYYICFDYNPVSPVGVDTGGNAYFPDFNIPLSIAPGLHYFTSHHNDPTCSLTSEAATRAITIGVPNIPAIVINDIPHTAHPWPDNSLVKVQISGHDTGVPVQVTFDGANMKADDGSDCVIVPATDRTGSLECVIPNGKAPGTYLMQTPLATSTVEVWEPSLAVTGGAFTIYDGMSIDLLLRKHAPKHSYRVFFGSAEIPLSAPNGVTTDDEGSKEVSYEIPLGTSGTFTIQSQDRGSPAPPSTQRQIAATTVTVAVPTDPVIVVEGGNRHPAGEVIRIHLRKHSPDTDYDLKLDGDRIDADLSTPGYNPARTDSAGDDFNIQYQIPISASGVKSLVSYLKDSSVYSATYELTILPQPYIAIEGGDQHAPGEIITIHLRNHRENTSYDVYIDGVLIQAGVVTDGSGSRSIQYTIPRNISPLGTEIDQGHPIESRRSGNQVAVTNLFVVAPDLMVTAINPPLAPQPGVDLPVALTIQNNSAITLTGFPFDNDLYVNPRPGVPSIDSAYPPGDDKLWINGLLPSQSVVITPVVKIFNEGTYSLYGRTDTSDRVTEGDREDNNIMSTSMIVACTLAPFSDNFSNGIVDNPGWNRIAFGSASVASVAPSQQDALVALEPGGAWALPPALPVVYATPLPVRLDEVQPASFSNIDYLVEPAVVESGAAAIPQAAPLTSCQTGLPALPSGWTGTDINTSGGRSGQSGSGIYVCGDGSDIWNTSDQFRYTYQSVSGDFTMTARMTSFNGDSDAWSKIGLMVRNNTDRRSVHGMIALTRDNGIVFQGRTQYNRNSSDFGSVSYNSNNMPVWLRLTRTGDTITTYYSTNGSTWTEVGSTTLNNLNSGSVLIGLAATAHNTSYRAAAVFDNITITGPATATPTATATPDDTPTPVPTPTNTPDASFMAPSGLTATASGGGVVLNWVDNSTTESGFIIERQEPDGSWTEVISIPTPDLTTYTDPGAACGTTYTYRVRAYRDGDGAISPASNEAAVTTTACLCTASSESGGLLQLCSNGGLITQNNDASGGYMFMNRPVNSPTFDMIVRLNGIPTVNENSLAGLEVRENTTSTARKVNLVIRNTLTEQLGAFARTQPGGAVTQVKAWTTAGSGLPVWLRIVRANGSFYFYYNARDSQDSPPVLGAWSLLGSAPDTMGPNVLVGMINTSASGTRAYSTWEQFQIGCLAAANANCGAVEEADGMVVVNAINYTDNFPSTSSSAVWQETSQGTFAAMSYTGSDYTGVTYTDAPMLEYTVDIQQPGTYYVWAFGYAGGTSANSIHVGLNGLTTRTADKMKPTVTGTGLRWFNTTVDGHPATLELTQGVHTINVWGREDGFKLIQLLLTTKQPGTGPGRFTPTTNQAEPQSACLVPVPPEFPPNLQQCTQVLQNTSFEDVTTPIWFYPGIENVGPWGGFNYPQPSTSFSVHMPAALYAGNHNRPFLTQKFQLPTWLNDQTTAMLELYKAVYKLPNITLIDDFDDSPDDHLYFHLRDESGNQLTSDILIATGADNTADGRDNVDPNNPGGGSSARAAADWVLVSKNIFDYFTVDPQLYAGKTVEAHFFAPNPGAGPNQYTTRFYMDVVKLNVCTRQPEPQPETGKGKLSGEILIFINGALRRYQGVQVWAYKVDGPLNTTYTINSTPGADNYSFHNMEPGTYVVYAQFVNTDGFTYGQSNSIKIDPGGASRQNLVLVLGG